MTTIDFTRNHFDLMGQPAAFSVDLAALEARYRELQAQVHPDRHAHLSETERRLSMQWATQVNAAYQTLKDPLNRARYLLQLNGVDVQEETNTAMPADFLMEQMEWREAIEEASQTQDVDSLEDLARRLQKEIRALQSLLGQQLDEENNLSAAALTVRKLKFLNKLDEEIGNAIEAALS